MHDMMCLDIYLSSLSADEYKKIKHHIKPRECTPTPLLSWDIYSNFYSRINAQLEQKNEINAFGKFALKLKLKNDIDAIFKDRMFEALVVTNVEKKIVWVNNGFTKMTGYTKIFALGKTPAFLQGEATEKETKKRIRAQILERKSFVEVITNYRKDKTTYLCELTIFPLYGQHSNYFLALERQVG